MSGINIVLIAILLGVGPEDGGEDQVTGGAETEGPAGAVEKPEKDTDGEAGEAGSLPVTWISRLGIRQVVGLGPPAGGSAQETEGTQPRKKDKRQGKKKKTAAQDKAASGPLVDSPKTHTSVAPKRRGDPEENPAQERQHVAPEDAEDWSPIALLLLFAAGFGAGFLTNTLTRRFWGFTPEYAERRRAAVGPIPGPRPKPSEEIEPKPKVPEPGPAPIIVDKLERGHAIAYDSLSHMPKPGDVSSSSWTVLPTQARVAVDNGRPYRAHHEGAKHDIAGVSVRGPGHFKAGIPCQDVHRCVVLADGTMIAAAADGVGSAKHSDVGARIAIDAAVDFLADQLSRGTRRAAGLMMEETLEASRGRVIAFAESSGEPVGALASTLLVALLQGDQLYTAHAGDGAIVMRVGGQWTLASQPEDTLYANYLTPVACDSAASKWRTHQHRGVEAVALLSDGLERTAVKKAGSGYEVNAGFFGPIHEALASAMDAEAGVRLLAETLDSLALRAANDDDKTLMMIGRSQRPRG